MNQLTYADREMLLQTFDSLKDEWNGPDDKLLSDVGDWARRLVPSFGFEHSLTRDVATLSRYLFNHQTDQDLSDIARGGLLYVLQASQHGPSKLGEFGLLDDAFICSYAVHEIRTRLGDAAIYNPPRLSRDEQHHAENLFLEFIEQPIQEDDDDVVAAAQSIGHELANLASCGLFRRLQKNIDFLVGIIGDSDRSREHQSYARAALNYIVCEQDAIDDRLGIVGYLDDNFIAQMAVDLIEPAREPWLNLLDATVGALPFLNSLIVDDGCGGQPVSEYMIVNAALSCAELRAVSDSTSTVLISPFTGPTPFLLGLIATLEMVHSLGQLEITEESFRPGQKVLVDNVAVAEFAGIETISDRKMFGLRQFRTEKRQRLQSVRYWPISDLRRLIPADRSRTTRGKLTHDLSRSDVALPGLEYLFNATHTTPTHNIESRVLVVTGVLAAHDMAKRLKMYGHALKDVVPMGHISSDFQVKPWSTRFGSQPPLLLFTADLDVACAYAEEHSETIEMVVVEATGRNSNKTASLRELQRSNLRTLVVSSEQVANEFSIADHDLADLWEWDTDDFSALLWPRISSPNGIGAVARHERRLQKQSSAAPQVKTIAYPLADESFQAVHQLETLARQRGEDRLAELDEVVAVAFGIISRLLRSTTPLSNAVPSSADIEQGIAKLGKIHRDSLFLSEPERSAVSTAEKLLGQFFEELKANNPKANILGEILAARPSLTVICPDARIRTDLELEFADRQIRILDTFGDDDVELDGVVIPGWFGKTRMARLLVPPVADPLTLVLYEIECRWHRIFRNEREKAKQSRFARGGRSKLFPTVKGWSEPTSESEPSADDTETSMREVDSIQQFVDTVHRQQMYQTARSDGNETEVPAYLIVFDGDAYAFLTDSYKANVVTHLLDGSIVDGEDKADIRQLTVKQLKPGDALLFHRGSSRDVIRSAADKILPAGIRETSSLWRAALLEYVAREALSSEDVWLRLKNAGCPLQHLTISIWLENENLIAPQSYKRDVRAIADVTADARLTKRFDDVIVAIREVRSAHLRASHQLAQQVLARAANVLKDEGRSSTLIEVEPNVFVVRVAEIDNSSTPTRLSLVNRLQEPEQWHA